METVEVERSQGDEEAIMLKCGHVSAMWFGLCEECPACHKAHEVTSDVAQGSPVVVKKRRVRRSRAEIASGVTLEQAKALRGGV